MWVVAELDDDYIAKMEDVLEVYERPYDPQQPVVCLDEKPVTLHADVRPASPAVPGREARRDNEYERCGTANVFCAVEPKAGRHFTFATPDRSGFEFAQVAVTLAMAYPEAKTIHLVMDNLNIHRRKSLSGCLRRGNGRRSLGSLHRPLHAHSRKLAQSGGDRNRDLLAAMSGQSTNPRSQDSAPGGESLEPAHEPRPHQDQLEVRPQSRPSQVRLQKEIFQAVKDLVPIKIRNHLLNPQSPTLAPAMNASLVQ